MYAWACGVVGVSAFFVAHCSCAGRWRLSFERLTRVWQVWVNSLSKSLDTVVAQKRVSGKILLQDNDRIEIGERQFIFHKDYNAPESAVKVCRHFILSLGVA